MNKVFYDYEGFLRDIEELSLKVEARNKYDCIVAVTRGGLIISQFLSYKMNIREIYTLNVQSYNDENQQEKVKILNELSFDELKNKKILIVDDLIDTGTTFFAIMDYLKQHPLNYDFVSLICKNEEILSQYNIITVVKDNNKTWYEFFWEMGDDN